MAFFVSYSADRDEILHFMDINLGVHYMIIVVHGFSKFITFYAALPVFLWLYLRIDVFNVP